jgi:hypothetical protein
MAGIQAGGGYREPPQLPGSDFIVKKEQQPSQDLSVTPHREEHLDHVFPESIPKISLAALPSTHAMTALLQAGAAIQEHLPSFPEPLALHDAIQDARTALAPAVSAVSNALPSSSAVAYLAMGAEAVGIAVAGTNYQALCQEIDEMQVIQDKSGGQDAELQVRLEVAYDRKKALQTESSLNILKLGLTAIKHGAAAAISLLPDLPQVTQALTVVSQAAGAFVGAVATGLVARAVHVNRKIAEKIPEVRKDVAKACDEATGLKKKILDLRVHNLDKQEEENRVGIVKNSISLASTVLGTVAGTKALLVAIGVTVGVAVGVSLTALGVGAAVLGGIGLAIGIGYLIYKNRFAIQHAYELAPKFIDEQFKALKIKVLSAFSESARDEIAYTEKKLDPTRYDSRLSSIQSKLAEKENEEKLLLEKNEKAGFFERIGNYLHIFVLRIEMYSLAHGKEQIEVKTSDAYIEHVRSVKQLSADALRSLDKRIVAVEQRIAKSIQERSQMQEDYKVYQHLGKFGEGSTEEEIEQLYQFHDDVLQATNEELQSMGIQVKNEATGDERWDAVIQFATQAVAA